MIVTFLKSLEFFSIENEGYCVCVISLIHKGPSHDEWGGIIIYHTEMFPIYFLTILPFLFFTLFYVCLCRILMDAGHFSSSWMTKLNQATKDKENQTFIRVCSEVTCVFPESFKSKPFVKCRKCIKDEEAVLLVVNQQGKET